MVIFSNVLVQGFINMTTTQHTPGPWLIAKPKGNGVMHKIWRTNGDERNTGYARIAWQVPRADDARLIAAAPDLLEAARALVGVFYNQEDVPLYVQKARAAIAKAEGR
jgi:hypothetical protein